MSVPEEWACSCTLYHLTLFSYLAVAGKVAQGREAGKLKLFPWVRLKAESVRLSSHHHQKLMRWFSLDGRSELVTMRHLDETHKQSRLSVSWRSSHLERETILLFDYMKIIGSMKVFVFILIFYKLHDYHADNCACMRRMRLGGKGKILLVFV